jgi:tRNA threonylcarbamoyladenosine biosynthesis protein TsaB
LLGELQLSMDAFDLFAVNAGPGSFTGLRVGLTAVKGWAETYGRPAVGISGLEAVAAQSQAASLLVPVLDARRGEVYFGFYERAGARLSRREADRVAGPEELLAAIKQHPEDARLQIVSPDVEVVMQIAAKAETGLFTYERVSAVLAPVIGQLARARALHGDTVDALALDANYVRRSDAELHRKGRP